jgi:hypothetical protein
MSPVARKLASAFALGAGAVLIYFEWRQAGGITADNAFWLFIGSLIIILAALNVFQKPGPHPHRDDDEKLPLG